MCQKFIKKNGIEVYQILADQEIYPIDLQQWIILGKSHMVEKASFVFKGLNKTHGY